MNVFREKGLPDLYINNIIIRFHFDVTFELDKIALIFGSNVFPIKEDSSSYVRRKKITVEMRKKPNEWYSQVPPPLQRYEADLKRQGIYDQLFYQCLQEERLERMKNSIEHQSQEYRTIDMFEPWVPPCYATIFRGGKCMLSGVRSEEQGSIISWSLARYFNEKMGIPARVRNFEILNIVCDTKLDFPIDIKRMAEDQKSIATISERFPALILKDSIDPRLMSLVYPRGPVVETGATNKNEIIARHRRVYELCLRFRADPNAAYIQNDRKRGRVSNQKKLTSGAHLADVNTILKSIIAKTTADPDLEYLIEEYDVRNAIEDGGSNSVKPTLTGRNKLFIGGSTTNKSKKKNGSDSEDSDSDSNDDDDDNSDGEKKKKTKKNKKRKSSTSDNTSTTNLINRAEADAILQNLVSSSVVNTTTTTTQDMSTKHKSKKHKKVKIEDDDDDDLFAMPLTSNADAKTLAVQRHIKATLKSKSDELPLVE